MSSVRFETDLLGRREVPNQALYGIHTVRALENFGAAERPVRRELIHAYGQVKLAAIRTNAYLDCLPPDIVAPLDRAAVEMSTGELDEHIVVDALQGGAGTATNMNVNEVLANRALQLIGDGLGNYQRISPSDHVNLHQSTNDTFPTALRVAAITAIRQLVDAVLRLQEEFQVKERAFGDVIKIGRTQGQDAVLTTLGRTMGAYAEAFTRDRWRLYKCEERLRIVNLGGTAIGTGIGARRRYIFRVVNELQDITGFGLVRAENLVEATQNQDSLVEVSGIIKSLATSLIKVCSDLRLLASGPEAGFQEIRLPPRQVGSSIMPGKINPVIPEMATQAALRAIGADATITMAVSMGQLELNPFLPLVADELLATLIGLRHACEDLARSCIGGLEANRLACRSALESTTAMATALVSVVGYSDASDILARADGDLRTTVLQAMSAERFEQATRPDAIMRLGFEPGDKR